MDALVVYESYWGNTEVVAREVAAGLAASLNVRVRHVADAGDDTAGIDLIVAGGPTHVLSMSRRRTRIDAARQSGFRGDPARGLRDWLAALPAGGPLPPVFTFDTRLSMMRHFPGSAARSAAAAVRRHGGRTPPDATRSFYVVDVEGPLCEGELERARQWGLEMGRAAMSGARAG